MRHIKILCLLLATAFGLSGCLSQLDRHLVPLSSSVKRNLSRLNMSTTDPILVRIYKEENELELWKRNKKGVFARFRTYEICAWSGELGPKIKEGDRQSPEGFYSVNKWQMNPNSAYFLAFNVGFPNKFDRSLSRTGSDIMVHGDCSSRGCYAMTDDKISEIYALAREAFDGGQKAFQVQIFPFRMTPTNLARHKNSPHHKFWMNLKEGADHFDITRMPPKVDVCDHRYVFNASAPGGGKLDPSAKCPVLKVEQSLQELIDAKQQADKLKFEGLSARNDSLVDEFQFAFAQSGNGLTALPLGSRSMAEIAAQL